MIRLILFDWGNTVMREQPDWPGKLGDAPHVEAMPEIEQALQALRPSYRLIIGSNADVSTGQDVRAALRRVGLDGYFDAFYTSRDIGVNKPDPRFFHAVLEGHPVSEAVMVGDTFEKDVLGAKQIGLRVVWYNTLDLPIPPNSPVIPDATIRSLSELPAAIRTLETQS